MKLGHHLGIFRPQGANLVGGKKCRVVASHVDRKSATAQLQNIADSAELQRGRGLIVERFADRIQSSFIC